MPTQLEVMAFTARVNEAKRACGCITFCIITPLWIWITLNMVNQSSVSLSLEDFSIADVQSSNVSNPNQTFIYFKLHLENKKDLMSLHYGNLSLTFSYYRTSSDDIVQLGNYTIQRFHQGISKKTHRQTSVKLDQGISWRQISKNATSVVSRVDLAGVVKFSELNFKSKKREILAWAKVELDPVSGKRISKKAVRLKHMIKHHVSGSVTFFFVFLIIVTICSPLSLTTYT